MNRYVSCHSTAKKWCECNIFLVSFPHTQWHGLQCTMTSRSRDLPRVFLPPSSFTTPATQEVAQAPLTDLEILRALDQSRAGNVCGFVVFNGRIAHIWNVFGDIFLEIFSFLNTLCIRLMGGWHFVDKSETVSVFLSPLAGSLICGSQVGWWPSFNILLDHFCFPCLGQSSN